MRPKAHTWSSLSLALLQTRISRNPGHSFRRMWSGNRRGDGNMIPTYVIPDRLPPSTKAVFWTLPTFPNFLQSTCHKLVVFTSEGATKWTTDRAIYRLPQLYMTIIQGASKRALQLWKLIEIYTEDIHNVLNCQNVAKHTEFYLG